MYQIAIIWWILSHVGGNNGKVLGFFLVLGALPAIVFVKFAGIVVDKTKSKTILVTSDLAAFFVVLLVFLALHYSFVTVSMVFFTGFIIATVEAFFNPALSKSLPLLVDNKDMTSAVAFQSSTQYLASFGGAVGGAILIDKLGISGVVLLNSISYLISAVCNAVIKFKYAMTSSNSTLVSSTSINPTVVQESGSSKDSSSLKEINSSGWKILKGLPFIKKVLIGFGCVNFFATPVLIVLPIYTKVTFNASASVLGFLEAMLWFGILSGTFASPFFDRIKSLIKLGTFCILTFAVCILFSGIVINKLFFGIMLFFGGFAIGVNNVRFVTFFQHSIGAEMKGRFFALMNAITSFTFPVSYLLFGALADYLLPPKLCLVQGLGLLCLSAYFSGLGKMERQAVGSGKQ